MFDINHFQAPPVGGVGDTTPTTGDEDTLRTVIQNTAGTVGRAGLSAALALAPASVKKNIGTINPATDIGPVGSYVLGNDPIEPVDQMYHEQVARGGDFGLFNKPIAAGATIGATALNLMPIVGNLEVGGTDLLAQALTKATSEDAVKAILTRAGFDAPIATSFAPEFAKMSNENEVRAALLSATKIQKTIRTGSAVADAVPTPEGEVAPLQRTPVPDTASPDLSIPERPQEPQPISPAEQPPVTGGAGDGTKPPIEGVPSSEEPYFNPDQYVKEQTDAQLAAAKAESGSIMTKVGDFLDNAKKKLVDATAPIEDTLAKAVKESNIKLAPSEDIHNQIDRVLRAPTLAGQFVKDNGLADIIRSVDDPNKLDQYMIAKHGEDLAKQGIETGRDGTKDAALVRALAPMYEDTAQKVNAYSQKLLGIAEDSGLISHELATGLRAKYPNYVPFERIFNEGEQVSTRTGAKGVASLSTQTAVRKIAGSTRQVASPLKTLLARTQEVITQAEKNEAGRILASYKKLPGNPFQLRELEPGEKATGKATISYFENGEKKTFVTTPAVAAAAKSLDVSQMNILGKIFAFPVRIARIGITGINPAFITANLAKDQVSAFINTDKALATSLANPNNFVRSALSAVKHDALYDEMVRAGGAGTSFDLGREQVAGTFDKIRSGRNIGASTLYTVTHPADLLRSVENIVARTEELTRLQQYRGTRLALMNQGMTENEAVIAAARAARENTVNFARHGEWGQVLNNAFLYLNAGIQGTRTLLRNLKEKPLTTVSKIAVGAFMPMAAATAWNLSDPQRKAAYDDIPEYEKQNNIIIVPPNPQKAADGKWAVIKIPLSQEIQNIVALVRRPIEAMHGENPVTFAEAAKALLGTVEPINPDQGSFLSAITPQAIKPTVEESVNKNLFTGFPVVPDSMSKLTPSAQVKPHTSGTAREIAGLFGGSPIKTEDFIKETFGGVGPQALNLSDKTQNAVEGAVGVPEDKRTVIGGTDPVTAVTSRFNEAASGAVEQKQTDAAAAAVSAQADESLANKNKAAQVIASIKGMDKETAAKTLNDATKGDPALAKAVKTQLDAAKLGLTTSDKMVEQLQIGNGERARYIDQQVRQMGSKEAKLAYLNDLAKKKIITAAVQKQLYDMWKAAP